MKITKAKFITSAIGKDKLLCDSIPEFAFVGRSNAGKSSFINAMVGQKKLAKTSSTPGHTKLINYFLINEEFHFVDLPGYGFHLAGKTYEEKWSKLIEEYLLGSKQLKRVFLLVDARHAPTELDKQMMEFLSYNNFSFSIIATKSDKLPKSKIFANLSIIAQTLGIGVGNIYPFSSISGLGKDKILSIMDEDLHSNL